MGRMPATGLTGIATLAVGLAALFVVPATQAAAATVTVPCSGKNSTDVAALKAAIKAANSAGGGTLELFARCNYTLSTVDNTGTGRNGLPKITTAVTIRGGESTITRSTAAGTPAFRFFEVSASGSLALSQLTLANGAGAPAGGAVYGAGPLTLHDDKLSGNSTVGDGGAVFESGVLTMGRTLIIGNTSAGDGGGIAADVGVANPTSSLTIEGSTFAANHAGTDGGAIHAGSGTVIINSTLSANLAPIGGSVYARSPGLRILDSTIAGNIATTAAGGGGIANAGPPSTVTVTNTILSGSTEGSCAGAAGLRSVTDGGHNLEDGTSCAFADHVVHGNPGLEPLAGSPGGGLVLTMSIGPTSPAYQAGDPAVCAAAPPNGAGGIDEDGTARKTPASCDIGAVEYAPSECPGAGCPNRPSPSAIGTPGTGAEAGQAPALQTGLIVAGAGVAIIVLTTAVGARRRDQIL